MRGHLNIVIVGHVDHGKSTLTGRLLSDLNVLPEGKVEAIRSYCANHAKPFEYAFILDALKEERRQGITIDVSRIFFRSENRSYMILDAPGHQEFIKNMVTGAARADLAILLVDAKEGVRENTRRHALLLSILKVPKVVVVINKMDLVNFEESIFHQLSRAIRQLLEGHEIKVDEFIPVSAYWGENLKKRSKQMSWYSGPTVFEFIEGIDVFNAASHQGLRLQVQDVYKFTEREDRRRIIAGSILSGTLKVGQVLEFLPSRQRGTVKSIESFSSAATEQLSSPSPFGITLEEELFITRGELGVATGEAGFNVGKQFRVQFFWLAKAPLKINENIFFKINSQRLEGRLIAIHSIVNACDLEKKDNQESVTTLDVCEGIVDLHSPTVFDQNLSYKEANRFVLVRDYQIVGGGLFTGLDDNTQSPFLMLQGQKINDANSASLVLSEFADLRDEEVHPSVWAFIETEIDRMRDVAAEWSRRGKKVVCLDFRNQGVAEESKRYLLGTLQDLGYNILTLVSNKADRQDQVRASRGITPNDRPTSGLVERY